MATRDTPAERKVQLTGGSTFTVSLPKEWAAEQNIEAGSTVLLYSRDDQLLITGKDTDERQSVATIDARNRDPIDLRRTVAAAYVAGCETVNIEAGPDAQQRRAIRDGVSGLVGIEVYAETDEEMTARTMLDVADLSPEQTLVQMELTALSMHEAAIDAVIASDGEAARQVISQDDDVDRLFGLICREFHQSLTDVSVSQRTDDLTTFEYYTTARQIERVADHAEKIAAVAERSQESPDSEVAEELSVLGDRSRSIVRRARTTLFDQTATPGDDRPTPDDLGEIIADAEDVRSDIEALDRRLYDNDAELGYLLGTVLDSIARTTEYGINIAEAGLQATMRESVGGSVQGRR